MRYATKDYRSEYGAYNNAKARCENPRNKAFDNYGLRGIVFQFTSFTQFMDHIGPKPAVHLSLDRIDTNAGYCLGNVKWSTSSEQNSNRRISSRYRAGLSTLD